jgi:signal transduction histidine kinase
MATGQPMHDGMRAEASIDSRWVDEPPSPTLTHRRWQQRLFQNHRRSTLLALSLLGAMALVLWLEFMSAQPHLPGQWRSDDRQRLVLVKAPESWGLGELARQAVTGAGWSGGALHDPPLHWLPQPERWVADDAVRQAHRLAQAELADALKQPLWQLRLADGTEFNLAPTPRGLTGLGGWCWLLGLLALGLYLVALLVLVSQPGLNALLFGVLALSQALVLGDAAADSLPGLGKPQGWAAPDLSWRLWAEALGAAAMLHLVLRLWPRWRWADALAAGGWVVAVLVAGLGSLAVLNPPTVWITGLALAGALTALAALPWPAAEDSVDLPRRLRRLVLLYAAGLLATTLAWAWQGDVSADGGGVTAAMSRVWTLVATSLVLLGPVLVRPRQSTRELLVLGGSALCLLGLHLLLTVWLGLGTWVALGLAVLLTVALFAAMRPLIASHLAGAGTLSAERLFDSLYRSARALEKTPHRTAEHVANLLREVFDPLEISRNRRPLSAVRVARDGSAMAVPLTELEGTPGALPGATTVLLRHARRGQRLFTEEDRELAERMLEQLRRAVAYDRAVERGRSEERTRIAQDLHDDIGARLLTLMYKAPNSEIEEYIRHTLQDLKTLTRGLATANPRLSHAAAEWKADISQRLHPTGCDLRWSYSADQDIVLNVVQWSGLTRVLRELVNNIISHAQASLVEIGLQFDGQWLVLMVADDGIGSTPEAWSHGLGLGGVRKRVKQLGGQVQWAENGGRGIRCDIRVPVSVPAAKTSRSHPPRP